MKICEGCGTSRSLEKIKEDNPRAVSCCPQRFMRELTCEEYEYLRENNSRFQRICRIAALSAQ